MAFTAWNRAAAAAAAAVLLGASAALADSMAVGFGAFRGDLNIAAASEPAAIFLRQAVGAGLVSLRRASDGEPAKGSFELVLADGVSVGPDYGLWSFRVRRGAVFQSGRPVSAEDVLFSLDQCRRNGLLKVKKSVSRRVKTPYDTVEEWVDIEVPPGQQSAQEVPRELAACPVWERASAELFGSSFGAGSNFVGAGMYRLASYRAGHQYSLVRVGRPERLDAAGAAELVLRSFVDPRRGLTALREGTIQALFVDQGAQGAAEALAKGRRDETLAELQCAGVTVLRRRDVFLSCSPDIDVAHLRLVR